MESIKIVWTSPVPGDTLADVYVNGYLSFVNLSPSDVSRLVEHIDPALCDLEYVPPEPDTKDIRPCDYCTSDPCLHEPKRRPSSLVMEEGNCVTQDHDRRDRVIGWPSEIIDDDDQPFAGSPWDDDKHLESYETDIEDGEAQAAYDDHWGTLVEPEGYGS